MDLFLAQHGRARLALMAFMNHGLVFLRVHVLVFLWALMDRFFVRSKDAEESPQYYLNLTIEVQERTLRDVSAGIPKINYKECTHLAELLKATVESARPFLLWQAHPYLKFEDNMAKCLDTFKLLFASAKQVQSFIQSCCNPDANSIGSAIILPTVSKHISLLSFDLELCRNIFSDHYKWDNASSTSIDSGTLSTDLEALSRCSKSDDERLLANFLRQRLRSLERPVWQSSSESSVGEVDHRSLLPTKRLGVGGFCTVHEAIWLGATVAMKKFRIRRTDLPIAKEVFRKEVALLAGMCHPHVISLMCFAIHDRWCGIVMELMDEDLFSLIERRMEYAPFTDLESVHMILQVAEGMLYLHEKGIAHRDLKSANIFVKHVKGMDKETERNCGYILVKVADFGLSKTKENSSRNSEETPNVGTGRWAAPETMKSRDGTETKLKYDPFQSDVFSFAMVCYEILAGEVPFSNLKYPREAKEKILLRERPKLPGHCHYLLEDLIKKCWSHEPSARPSFAYICEKLRLLKHSLILDTYWSLLIPKSSKALYKVNEPILPLEVEIVFIHGYQLFSYKDAFWKTWMGGEKGREVFWPKTWLGEDFPGARIWSLSYDACAVRADTSETMDLFLAAENLVQQMVEFANIGEQNRPIVFVCHCLGGLVVKEIVRTAHVKFGKEPKYRNFLNNVRGFHFYSTPHNGSKLADLAAHLRSMGELVDSPRLIKTEELDRLNSEFERIDYAYRWKFSVISETYKTKTHGFSAVVVEEESARHVYNKVLPVSADHFGVCKPKSRGSSSYLAVRDFIKDVVDDSKLKHDSLELLGHVVGMEDKFMEVCKKLKAHPIVGLVGMGGIGKTTLSKYFYNRGKESLISSSFWKM